MCFRAEEGVPICDLTDTKYGIERINYANLGHEKEARHEDGIQNLHDELMH